MNSKNGNYSINSLSTRPALPPEVLNYDSAQFKRLAPGYFLGEFKNYRLLECLGEGGMGQTWLAEELSGGKVVRKVVVKILSKELCGHEEALAEVQRVFDLTSNLFHPNICATLGMKEDPSFGWILVMVHADGGTLWDWFRAQPNHENGLPLEWILPILRPIAEALDYAHREGILHRDVKPQNIMFFREKPVLIDFGLAARSQACSTSGTPMYMAPEQMMGKPQTGRTDQYALALVLYELLAGTLPFIEENFVALALEKVSFNPENPNFPALVNTALRKALSPNPETRFGTCSEFFNALTVTSAPVPPAPVAVSAPKVNLEELKKQLDGEFEYEISDDSVTITKFLDRHSASVTIPHGVTTIGEWAFSNCKSLTSVTIPDSVTCIGEKAFDWCESLTIYGKAGSEAERYAKEEGVEFKAIEEKRPGFFRRVFG